MLRKADTDQPCLHLDYEWWDEMIEKMRVAISKGAHSKDSKFYEVVHNILVERWNKSNTPLHCLAHSLNPRYYSHEWLQESPNRLPPHRDIEVSRERKKCIERYNSNSSERRSVNEEFDSFSATIDDFSNNDAMRDRGLMSPTKWWVIHGASAPTLQSLALKLLGQPSSSSCYERNWSTYSFIHSLKRNKITPQKRKIWCRFTIIFDFYLGGVHIIVKEKVRYGMLEQMDLIPWTWRQQAVLAMVHCFCIPNLGEYKAEAEAISTGAESPDLVTEVIVTQLTEHSAKEKAAWRPRTW
ncbi:uncharacterized protein LOC121991167 [Zingiber officinale]|uniref:uncharacterized protein LOC121991167 n=1 Tax=Zingiber officinale TaxID=94328 RepID=UPI001C4D730A|nr:uncharacterized protein LOC121991167 [Zingiber officinale]